MIYLLNFDTATVNIQQTSTPSESAGSLMRRSLTQVPALFTSSKTTLSTALISASIINVIQSEACISAVRQNSRNFSGDRRPATLSSESLAALLERCYVMGNGRSAVWKDGPDVVPMTWTVYHSNTFTRGSFDNSHTGPETDEDACFTDNSGECVNFAKR